MRFLPHAAALGLVSPAAAQAPVSRGGGDLSRQDPQELVVTNGTPDEQSPWTISKFLELKTVWHPVGQ